MIIDLSRFKVVHGDKILNAVALMDVRMPDDINWEARETVIKPNRIDVLAINEDGNIVSIMDEAWTFQFLPIIRTPDKQGYESVIEIIEQVCEDICDNYCMYRDTVDDECLCDVTRNGGRCPLDRLN